MTARSRTASRSSRRGRNCCLEDELADVRDRLQQAERADAVRAVAVLEAAQHLAVGEQRERHQVEDDEEDRQRLDELHPPRLVVADLGEGSRGLPRRDRQRRRRAASRPGPRRRAATWVGIEDGSTGPDRRDGPRRASAAQRVDVVLARALGQEDAARRDRLAQADDRVHAGAVADATRSPSLIPSACASAGESSATCLARMNCSAGERSTSLSAHSGR